jgi:tetratricopeptide (TPR) repeat protein
MAQVLAALMALMTLLPPTSSAVRADSPAANHPRAIGPAEQAGTDVEARFARGLDLFREAQRFEQANPTEQPEAARRFGEAAEVFESLYANGVVSTKLLTNIANCYYFAGDIGKAVLFYRRALLADPSNRIARDSLGAVRVGLPIREPPPGPAASLLQAMLFWHHHTPFHVRKAALMFVFPLVWILFAAGLWRSRPFRLLGWAMLAVSLLLAGSVVTEASAPAGRHDGVIMVETVGRRGDHLSYSPSHSRPLPPGTELIVLEQRSGGRRSWLAGRLLDGTESWVAADRVARVVQ